MSGRPRGPGRSENGFRCGDDEVTVDLHLIPMSSDDDFLTYIIAPLFYMLHRKTVTTSVFLILRPATVLRLELCADELVVGGGVGWSYDRRRRRDAHFS